MKGLRHLLGVFVVAGVVAGVAAALHNDYYLRIFFMTGVYYLCAAGMNVLVGYAGQKSLGQAGLFAAGAYAVALLTSLRAVAENPVTMAAWGLIVAALLALGSLPFFLGLPVVLPILGHATWHLYRKVVVADESPHPIVRPLPKERRPAADFPAALFPWRNEKK